MNFLGNKKDFLSNVIFFSEVRRPLAEGVVLASPCPPGMSSVEKNARPPLTPGPNNACPIRRGEKKLITCITDSHILIA